MFVYNFISNCMHAIEFLCAHMSFIDVLHDICLNSKVFHVYVYDF